MSCTKVSRFLDAHGIEVLERVSASRKLGKTDATTLIRNAREVFVAKGKKLERFKGGTASRELVDRVLGATGNLRSPTLKVGKVLVVGFNEETLEQVLLDGDS
jgi:arsenate reductase-like glutaredoxin family protein